MNHRILVPTTSAQEENITLGASLVEQLKSAGKLNYWTHYYALLVENLQTGAWLINDRGNIADTVIAKKDKLVSINGSKLINYETEVGEFVEIVERMFKAYIHHCVRHSGDKGSRYSVYARTLAGNMVSVDQIGKLHKNKALINGTTLVNYTDFDNMLKVLNEYDVNFVETRRVTRKRKPSVTRSTSRSLAMDMDRRLEKLSFVEYKPTMVGETSGTDLIKFGNHEYTRDVFWRTFIHEESEDLFNLLTQEQIDEISHDEVIRDSNEVENNIRFLMKRSVFPYTPGDKPRNLTSLFSSDDEDDY